MPSKMILRPAAARKGVAKLKIYVARKTGAVERGGAFAAEAVGLAEMFAGFEDEEVGTVGSGLDAVDNVAQRWNGHIAGRPGMVVPRGFGKDGLLGVQNRETADRADCDCKKEPILHGSQVLAVGLRGNGRFSFRCRHPVRR